MQRAWTLTTDEPYESNRSTYKIRLEDDGMMYAYLVLPDGTENMRFGSSVQHAYDINEVSETFGRLCDYVFGWHSTYGGDLKAHPRPDPRMGYRSSVRTRKVAKGTYTVVYYGAQGVSVRKGNGQVYCSLVELSGKIQMRGGPYFDGSAWYDYNGAGSIQEAIQNVARLID